VCGNRLSHQHEVFAAFAAQGKRAMSWFFDFKLHPVVGDTGETFSLAKVQGNVAGRQPVPA